jgi:hypothetical protein
MLIDKKMDVTKLIVKKYRINCNMFKIYINTSH